MNRRARTNFLSPRSLLLVVPLGALACVASTRSPFTGAGDDTTDAPGEVRTDGGAPARRTPTAGTDGGKAEDSGNSGVGNSSNDLGVNESADASRDAVAPPTPACVPACGAQSACVAGKCTAARRVFVSSRAYASNFGGHAGADAVCATVAKGVGLPGAWKAWVSDDASSPSARFTHATVGYRLVDGTLVAASWAALTSGSLAHAIDRDEYGALVANTEVWTATGADGTLVASACGNFRSNVSTAANAAVGLTSKTDKSWSNIYLQFCDRTNLRLYCVEQ